MCVCVFVCGRGSLVDGFVSVCGCDGNGDDERPLVVALGVWGLLPGQAKTVATQLKTLAAATRSDQDDSFKHGSHFAVGMCPLVASIDSTS